MFKLDRASGGPSAPGGRLWRSGRWAKTLGPLGQGFARSDAKKDKVVANAKLFADELIKKDYNIISNGTENHCLLIDLRNKNISGKEAESSLGISDITVNKNMVPFDDKSPFVTSGIRIGTAAITTRGVDKSEIIKIADLIDQNISNFQNQNKLLKIKNEVNELMNSKPLFKW